MIRRTMGFVLKRRRSWALEGFPSVGMVIMRLNDDDQRTVSYEGVLKADVSADVVTAQEQLAL